MYKLIKQYLKWIIDKSFYLKFIFNVIFITSEQFT